MRFGERSHGRSSAWARAMLCALPLVFAFGFDRPADAGPLITNGSFADTLLGTGANQTVGTFLCDNNNQGQTCISNMPGWSGTCAKSGCNGTASPSSLLYADGTSTYFSRWNGTLGLAGSLAAPPFGGNVVALDGDQVNYQSSLFQTVSGLSIGDRYQLTFWQAAAQQKGSSGASTDTFKVTFGNGATRDTQYGSTMNDASQGVVGWNLVTMDFIATSTSEILTFLDIGTPNGQPPVGLLANVDLIDIPEPASLALLAGAMAALRVARRRK